MIGYKKPIASISLRSKGKDRPMGSGKLDAGRRKCEELIIQQTLVNV